MPALTLVTLALALAGAAPESAALEVESSTEDAVMVDVAVDSPVDSIAVDDDVEALPVDPAPSAAPVGPAPPPAPEWGSGYVRVVPPRYRGTGQFVIAGLLAGSVLLKQLSLTILCEDPGCDTLRIYDRVALVGAVTLVGTGMNTRGRSRAYHDALARAPRPAHLQRRKGAAWAIAGVGALLFGVDAVLHVSCVAGEGPYFQPGSGDPWSFNSCGGWVGSAMMDLGAGMMGAGLGMVTFARRYERDRGVYDRGRVVALPQVGRGFAGLALTGRF